ncbi:MAG: CheR family methyltransferase [Oceanococcus sp.]
MNVVETPQVQTSTLDQKAFERVRTLIYQRAGISLGESKQAMVYGRLSKRLRQLQQSSLDDYLDELDNPHAEEWQHFTNALTTNLTSFFREAHHFDHLAQVLRQSTSQDRFRIWCTASSTGEEPYSIAMVAEEAGRTGPRKTEILASDIDTQVLSRAAEGVYQLDRIEGLSNSRKKAFFQRGIGPRDGYCRIRPQLRKKLSFEQINLLHTAWPIETGLDVIFCRNVLIYFDKPTQSELVRRFAAYLKPGGILYVGHSESQFACEDQLRIIDRTTYQKVVQ